MKVLDFFEKLNFFEKNGAFTRYIDGYNLSILCVKAQVSSFVVSVFVEGEVDKFEVNDIKKQLKTPVSYVANEHSYCINLQLPPAIVSLNEKYVLKCQGVIENFVKLLKEKNFVATNKCVFCGQEAEFGGVNGVYQPMHIECKEKFKQETLAALENVEKAGKGNLPISIFLAILGGVVGLIPSIILLFAFQYMLALLFALVPIGALFAYKLGKAPVNNTARTIIIIISFVLNVGVMAGFYLLASLVYEGGQASFFEEFGGDVFKDIMITFLFTVIGIFIVWRYISNTTTNAKKEIQKM